MCQREPSRIRTIHIAGTFQIVYGFDLTLVNALDFSIVPSANRDNAAMCRQSLPTSRRPQ